MTTQTTSVSKNFSKTFKVSIRFFNRMAYLCNKHKNIEWSAIFFYKEDGDNTIIFTNLIPIHTGSSSNVHMDFSGGVLNSAWQMHIEDDGGDMEDDFGVIHSHHTMNTSPSRADIQSCCKNAEEAGEMLYLVCNNYHELHLIAAYNSNRLGVLYRNEQIRYTIDLEEVSDAFKDAVNKMTVKHNASIDSYGRGKTPSYWFGGEFLDGEIEEAYYRGRKKRKKS